MEILQQTQKPSKYKSCKTIIDGVTFASAKEARRYSMLRTLEKAGKIRELVLQPKYELQPGFKLGETSIRPIHYVADFTYIDANTDMRVIEDVKASEYFKTDVYKLKRKLFMWVYKMQITEVY